jgi:hypothetical protein
LIQLQFINLKNRTFEIPMKWEFLEADIDFDVWDYSCLYMRRLSA